MTFLTWFLHFRGSEKGSGSRLSGLWAARERPSIQRPAMPAIIHLSSPICRHGSATYSFAAAASPSRGKPHTIRATQCSRRGSETLAQLRMAWDPVSRHSFPRMGSRMLSKAPANVLIPDGIPGVDFVFVGPDGTKHRQHRHRISGFDSKTNRFTRVVRLAADDYVDSPE